MDPQARGAAIERTEAWPTQGRTHKTHISSMCDAISKVVRVSSLERFPEIAFPPGPALRRRNLWSLRLLFPKAIRMIQNHRMSTVQSVSHLSQCARLPPVAPRGSLPPGRAFGTYLLVLTARLRAGAGTPAAAAEAPLSQTRSHLSMLVRRACPTADSPTNVQ